MTVCLNYEIEMLRNLKSSYKRDRQTDRQTDRQRQRERENKKTNKKQKTRNWERNLLAGQYFFVIVFDSVHALGKQTSFAIFTDCIIILPPFRH